MAFIFEMDHLYEDELREYVDIEEKENLCLYGHPNESWEVTLPAEEIPPELPEQALGINFARDGMNCKVWLSLVSVYSDYWLLSVAFYLGARLNRNESLSKAWYMLSFALQGVLSMMYGPLMGMITLRYPASEAKQSVFHSHRELFDIAAGSFIGMVAGFAVMIYTFIEAEDSAHNDGEDHDGDDENAVYPSTLVYQALSGFVFACVIMAPAQLVVIALVPKEDKWVGYVVATVIGVAVCVITFFGPLKSKFCKGTDQATSPKTPKVEDPSGILQKV